MAKRFKKKNPPKKTAGGKSLRAKIGNGRSTSLTESNSMSNLFNDTTRLRLSSRPKLSSMFSHEAPVTSVTSVTRPKDPPPPPPPVEPVLLPVTPPRKVFPFFTNDELDRINSVINGRNDDLEENGQENGMKNGQNELKNGGQSGLENFQNGLQNFKNGLKNGRNGIVNGQNRLLNGLETVSEDDTIDEFSSDEFSEDEFDLATYENMATSEVKTAASEESEAVYDSVPEMIEEDSLEEKMSFGGEYDSTSEAGGESPPPLPTTPPPGKVASEVKAMVEKALEKTIIFTSASQDNEKSLIKSNVENHQILISSSSWIDLQGTYK